MDFWDSNMNMSNSNQGIKIPYEKLSLAMAYVPFQPAVNKVFNAMEALKIGTLFPELDKPWLGERGN